MSYSLLTATINASRCGKSSKILFYAGNRGPRGSRKIHNSLAVARGERVGGRRGLTN